MNHHRTVAQQFLRFAVVGTLGFLVDSATLMLMIRAVGMGPIAARLVSFLCAATFTWAANRLFTFKEAPSAEPAAAQWLRFLCINALGGAVNVGIYALLISHVTAVAHQPVLGVAAGSIGGLIFNFTLSRSFVFNAHRTHRTPASSTLKT